MSTPANAFVNREGVSALLVALLVRSIVLPRTILRADSGEFSGPSGGKTVVRVRVPRRAKEQTIPGSPIDITDIDEVSVLVALRHLYDAAPLSDEDRALKLESYGSQVLAPQVAAVAEGAENIVGAALNNMQLDGDHVIDNVTVGNMDASVLAARRVLGRRNVPAGRRWLAMSPEFAEHALQTKQIEPVDRSGSPSALRDAVVGRWRGFMSLESNAIAEGTAVAYHESAAASGWRTPRDAAGADNRFVGTEGGFTLRHVEQFDIGRLSSIAATSVFVGASPVPDRDLDDLDTDTDGDDSGEGEHYIRAVRLTLDGAPEPDTDTDDDDAS